MQSWPQYYCRWVNSCMDIVCNAFLGVVPWLARTQTKNPNQPSPKLYGFLIKDIIYIYIFFFTLIDNCKSIYSTLQRNFKLSLYLSLSLEQMLNVNIPLLHCRHYTSQHVGFAFPQHWSTLDRLCSWSWVFPLVEWGCKVVATHQQDRVGAPGQEVVL